MVKTKNLISLRLCAVALGILCSMFAGSVIKSYSQPMIAHAKEATHVAPTAYTKTGTDTADMYKYAAVVVDNL